MTRSNLTNRTLAALVLFTLGPLVLGGQAAVACPEIEFDPISGIAVPQPDLQEALADLSKERVLADRTR